MVKVSTLWVDMAVIFDFKNPILVVVGHWNGAILNEPGWIARHILDVPEGQQVDLQAVLVAGQNPVSPLLPEKQIWLFDSYGLCCVGQRLEFYTRDISNLDELYAAAKRIAEKLPHTPKSALGVNFNIQVSGDLAALVPRFETQEVFDQAGVVRGQERTDSIAIGEDLLPNLPEMGKQAVQLNLIRKSDFATSEINFNYHSNFSDENFLLKWIAGSPIQHWHEQTKKLANEVYELDDIDAAYL